MADENNNSPVVASTEGHEDEVIKVSGLKASLQKLKTDKIDTLLGPTYDAANRKVTFPVTAKCTYDSANRKVIFN